MDFINKIKRSIFISSLLTLILGIIIAFNPEITFILIAKLIGWIFLISGAVFCFEYFMLKQGSHLLLLGLIQLLIGIFIIISPQTIAGFITFFLAVALLLHSFNGLQESFNKRLLGYSRWWIEAIPSILSFILGLIVLFNPFATVSSLVMFAGIGMIVSSAANIVALLFTNK